MSRTRIRPPERPFPRGQKSQEGDEILITIGITAIAGERLTTITEDILESAQADYPEARIVKAIRHRSGVVVDEHTA